jgi:hypothetical protein
MWTVEGITMAGVPLWLWILPVYGGVAGNETVDGMSTNTAIGGLKVEG